MYKRMIGVDIIRIIIAIFVFFRHLITLGGCNLHFNEFILSQTDIVMSMFFVMSGFCLYKNNNSFDHVNCIFDFYKKRIIRLMPVYWIVEIYLVIVAIIFNEDAVKRLQILPIRLFGIQIHFNSSIFGGVSWFVSCILVCYLIYPIFLICINQRTISIRLFICISLIFLLIYISLLNRWIGDLELYYNPLFRTLEFSYGVVLGVISNSIIRKINIIKIVFCSLAVVIFIILAEAMIFYQVVDFFKYILISIIIIFAGAIQFPKNNIVVKVITFLSSLTFEMFILQDILFNHPISYVLSYFSGFWKMFFYIAIMIGLIFVFRFLMMGIKYLFSKISPSRL